MWGLFVASAGFYLWSKSVPGTMLIPWLIGGLGLALVIGITAIVLVSIVWHGLRRGDWRRPRWFLGVVVALAVLVGLVAIDAPLRIRFFISLDALEDVAAASGSGDVAAGGQSLRAGLFSISHVRVLPEGVLLFDSNGNGFDDAGFAYLPTGNLPQGDGSFEAPQFRSLGGDWYAFTSSW